MAWTPFQIGDVTLQHRVVLAPLTRGRASLSTKHERTSVPNELMNTYYTERATPGGLLISEASPVSVRASGLPGIPGMFTEEQQEAWKPIVASVHAKGGVFFGQLWHQGRTTHSNATGQLPESASSIPVDGSVMWSGVELAPFEAPKAMTHEDITATQTDFFHHSNINQRTDEYGGSPENRCRFTLETVDKVCAAVGSGRVGVRLTPFGLFNQTHGEKRIEQWTYLCKELSTRNLAYVHMVEPRFDEFKGAGEKALALSDMSLDQDISLAPFRAVLAKTPLISAGGFGPDNFEEGVENGSYDLVAFGRFFVANPDLVERLKNKEPLYKWDRSRFYGPFEDNAIGYTVHPTRVLAASTDRLKAQLAA
ncbi:hypothetical protein IAR55_000704 [Kwoniella newhampshirensis]|uniref:NADH:flavin oxidoreductase/NADH oxidase N-terminal domain-containing protein n=1 Tax=Kwoniella newhampshirensis TaxID=1651941 RepID=A0AAW0Z8U1_9TREE